MALRHGHTNVVFATNDTGAEQDAGLFAFERTGGDAGAAYALVVIGTNATHASAASITVTQPEGTVLVDVLNGNAGAPSDRAAPSRWVLHWSGGPT